MPVNWTTNYQFVTPSAAAGLSVTPIGSAWGNSTYVQISASTGEDWVLTGVVVGSVGIAVEFEVDVAVGAAASEVVIGTVKGQFANAAAYGDRGSVLQIKVGLDTIPTGSRLSFRLRINSTDVTAWTFAFTYLKKPIAGNLLTSNKVLYVAPSATGLIALNATSAGWGNVAWKEITAAAASAQMIVALIFNHASATLDYELDIGIGTAGGESVITTWRNRSTGGTGGGPDWFAVENPLNAVPIGSRVAIRWRSASTEATPLRVGYAYLDPAA